MVGSPDPAMTMVRNQKFSTFLDSPMANINYNKGTSDQFIVDINGASKPKCDQNRYNTVVTPVTLLSNFNNNDLLLTA